ncbi:uncharacterized protein TNCV_3188971 [Trichonephila clavipes]|nr:uncharacterized protein TNCV_3188971 [Trichonephila clavipes]
MHTFLSGKRAFDDNKGSTSTQTSMVSKIKSMKYSQKYLNFGFITTEINDKEKGPSSLCVKTYISEEQHVKVVFKTKLWPPRPLYQWCGQCDVEQCGDIVPLTRAPLHQYTVIIFPKTNRDSSLNTNLCQSVTFLIDRAWHHSRRSCRCSGVKGSARKGCLNLRFASVRCLEIVCGTIATPTSARIVEWVTVESTCACRTILRTSLLVVFLVAPDPVFRSWVPSRVHYSQQFLTAHSERSTWPATWLVNQPAVFI